MNAQIAQHLNVAETAILEIQEWAKVLWVRVRGIGARFVSKKVVKVSKKIGQYVLSDSLVLNDDRVCCTDCGRWEYVTKIEAGMSIRHSSRCDLNEQPKKEVPQPIKKDRLAKAAEAHLKGFNVDSDLVFEAYKAGHISMSDAMNSDF